MTVTYTLSVAESRLSGFPKLLIKWKGSIYKLLYREMIIFCIFFYLIHLIYHLLLDDSQKRIFNQLSNYCDTFTNFIPLSFVLGFYVTMVVTRWWQQWLAIPWPDKLAMLISAFVIGDDERSKLIRVTLMRYMITMECLTFQAISTSIRKRFPAEEDLITAGLMTQEELDVYLSYDDSYGRWWIPGCWFTSLITEAAKEGKIRHEMFLREIINEMHIFRSNCGSLFAFDWISIPLVYTQTVTIAVYTYFGAKLIGRQYTSSETIRSIVQDQLAPLTNQSDTDSITPVVGEDLTATITFYIPFFTIAEFFFFMGWLKVAEQLINPFGEDDDDYDCNWILDRNIFVSFLIVDKMNNKHPDLNCYTILPTKPDIVTPTAQLTNDLITRRASINPHSGSTMNLNVTRRPSRSINFLGSLSSDKLTDDHYSEMVGGDCNSFDDESNLVNPVNSNNQDPLSWEQRAMSFCNHSDEIFPLKESRQLIERGRKLSLEENRSIPGKMTSIKLPTHVECNEETEGQSPENQLNDEFRLLLNPKETESNLELVVNN
ncbi:bestrophin-4-like isoform X2 [Panonychus citri]|uniref:bestrophin-4-like isoform X2 n=1 Tax=Panonychus citri TaxID=50023 RepID=UPI0023077637|nr:bestrophin-4-like isoform X2 [Panonychus citri]